MPSLIFRLLALRVSASQNDNGNNSYMLSSSQRHHTVTKRMDDLPQILRRPLLLAGTRMSRRTDVPRPRTVCPWWQWVLYWSLHGIQCLTQFRKLKLTFYYRTRRTILPHAPRDAPTTKWGMSPTTLVQICGLVAGRAMVATTRRTRLSLPLRPNSCSLQHPRSRRRQLLHRLEQLRFQSAFPGRP